VSALAPVRLPVSHTIASSAMDGVLPVSGGAREVESGRPPSCRSLNVIIYFMNANARKAKGTLGRKGGCHAE
jgi:hypothetical protein